ncbi:MAG: hypothetical protein HC778_03495 [Chamaesiphon sp. CSU_1_12]|nr:hypothetical protein [Chamaesiphon sp. CSU_1_12]
MLVHGLTDSPHFMRDIGEYFCTEMGFDVYIPLLRAHGLKDPQDMKNVSAIEWKKCPICDSPQLKSAVANIDRRIVYWRNIKRRDGFDRGIDRWRSFPLFCGFRFSCSGW